MKVTYGLNRGDQTKIEQRVKMAPLSSGPTSSLAVTIFANNGVMGGEKSENRLSRRAGEVCFQQMCYAKPRFESRDLIKDFRRVFTITKNKKKLVGIGISVVIVATLLIFFMGIRWEFKIHLEEKYPDKSFKIGLLKIDPIYGRF